MNNLYKTTELPVDLINQNHKNIIVTLKNGKVYDDVVLYTDHDWNSQEIIDSLYRDAKPNPHYKWHISIRWDYKQYNIDKKDIEKYEVYKPIIEKHKETWNIFIEKIMWNDYYNLKSYDKDIKDFLDVKENALNSVKSSNDRIKKYWQIISDNILYKKYCFENLDMFTRIKKKKEKTDLWESIWSDLQKQALDLFEKHKWISSQYKIIENFYL